MIIYPAIDIKDGKCVRMSRGMFGDVNVFSNDPFTVACKWEEMGAEYLHILDLDGVDKGYPCNTSVISAMAVNISIPLQLSGGVRTIENVETLLNKGIHRIVIGTFPLNNVDFINKAIMTFGKQTIVELNAKNGKISVEGWETTKEIEAIDFAKKMQYYGSDSFIYTDVTIEGLNATPNFKAMEKFIDEVKADVIVSGGVMSVQDITTIKNIGAKGIIIGRGLYTGAIDLKEAIVAAK